jgi:hypothetical protein
MNIRQTIIKLLTRYTLEELMRHIAYEIEEQGNHYLTVGAPIRADYRRRQVAVLRNTAVVLETLPYVVPNESTIDPKPGL